MKRTPANDTHCRQSYRTEQFVEYFYTFGIDSNTAFSEYINFAKPFEENDRIKYRVLITRDDEDEQIISSFFEDNIKVGTIIHWLRTDTYWLVHEHNINQIAYFEGKMIECKNFQITVDGEKFSTWGRIVFTSKTGEEMFDKTLIITNQDSMEIWIPNTELNLSVFKTGVKLKVLDQTWKINSVNYITKN